MKGSTLASQLLLIAALAAGLAAMRHGSDLAASSTFTLTLATLCVGLLGAIVCRKKAAWIGFALFGWGYFLSTIVNPIKEEIQPRLATTTLVDCLSERMHNIPPEPPDLPFQQWTNPSDNNDRHGKRVNGQWVPMSSAEVQLYESYIQQLVTRGERRTEEFRQTENAQGMGHLLLALTFAFLGAKLGRFLANRDESNGLATSSQPDRET